MKSTPRPAQSTRVSFILSPKSKPQSLKRSESSISSEKSNKSPSTRLRAVFGRRSSLFVAYKARFRRLLFTWKTCERGNCLLTTRSCSSCNKSSISSRISTARTSCAVSQPRTTTWCSQSTSARWCDVSWPFTLSSSWERTTRRRRNLSRRSGRRRESYRKRRRRNSSKRNDKDQKASLIIHWIKLYFKVGSCQLVQLRYPRNPRSRDRRAGRKFFGMFSSQVILTISESTLHLS